MRDAVRDRGMVIEHETELHNSRSNLFGLVTIHIKPVQIDKIIGWNGTAAVVRLDDSELFP